MWKHIRFNNNEKLLIDEQKFIFYWKDKAILNSKRKVLKGLYKLTAIIIKTGKDKTEPIATDRDVDKSAV